jgi:hypothetical protein
MNKNVKRFASCATTFGTTVMLGSLLMVGGCGGGGGGDSTPATTTKTTAIPAGTVTAGATAGSLAVAPGQTVAAKPEGSTVDAISIPQGVTITPPAGTTFTAATTIAVTSYNSVSALPAAPTGYSVNSVDGAVDVTIGGVSGVTFTGGQATITIPITGTVTGCEVYVNKGSGYVHLGPAINSATCNTDRFATYAVSDLCTFVVNPIYKNIASGSTGSPGSTGF